MLIMCEIIEVKQMLNIYCVRTQRQKTRFFSVFVA